MAPTILVTGFTGGLGASVLSTLQDLIPASSLAASSSRESAASSLKDKDISFRRAAYDDFDSLLSAFHGIQKLFFVSANTFDNEKRIRQHRNVIEAAKQAGVSHVYYSSLAFGGHTSSSTVAVQQAHLVTEAMLSASGLKYTSIREALYADAFPLFLNWYPDTRELFLPADGPIAYASRAELGEASAKLMLSDAYQFPDNIALLTGPKALTFNEIVEAINRVSGRDVLVHRVSDEEYVTLNATGDEGGKPVGFFEAWKGVFEGVAKGESETVDPLMEELLGRRPKDGVRVVEELLGENRDYTWHQNYMNSK